MDNREKYKLLLPIIEAYSQGKVIEVKKKLGWEPVEILKFGLSSDKYRIKPEVKYIPFDINTILVGKTVKSLVSKKIYLITAQQTNYVFLGNESHPWTYKNLLTFFIFLDGTPCGILNY